MLVVIADIEGDWVQRAVVGELLSIAREGEVVLLDPSPADRVQADDEDAGEKEKADGLGPAERYHGGDEGQLNGQVQDVPTVDEL